SARRRLRLVRRHPSGPGPPGRRVARPARGHRHPRLPRGPHGDRAPHLHLHLRPCDHDRDPAARAAGRLGTVHLDQRAGGLRRRRTWMNEHHAVRSTDVAAAAGVSSATVSRVLNVSTSVAPQLDERVRQAALAANYVRNANGRALRRQRSDTWAVIVSDLQNPFFTSLVAAVERVAVRAGYSVMLCNTDEQLDRENTYLDAAIAQRMAGVVVSVTSEEASDLARLTRAQVPTVVVDRRVHDFTGDTILLDNVRAGRMAAEHLLELGHRDILCLAGP